MFYIKKYIIKLLFILNLIVLFDINCSLAEAKNKKKEVEKIEVCFEGVNYIVDSVSMEALVTGGKLSESKKLIVPDFIVFENQLAAVTGISDYAFFESGFEEAEIGNNVAFIGEGAFAFSEKLQKVNVPCRCLSINDAAFFMCKGLEVIGFDDKACLKDIGKGAFSGTSVKKVVIPDKVETVGEAAFAECIYLKKVKIGKSCKSIGQGAFSGCSLLSSISCRKQNKFIKVSGGCIYSYDGKKLLSGASASGKIVVLDGTNLIASHAFEGNRKIESIVVSDSVKIIEEDAFLDASGLVSVKLGKGITTIKANAFFGCSSLESITIPKSVKSIEGNPFKYCERLASISVNSKNKYFAVTEGMLISLKTKSIISAPFSTDVVNIPAGCEYIGEFAFCGNTGLKKLNIDKNIKAVGKGAFYDCSSLIKVCLADRTMDFSVEEFFEEDGEKVFCGIFGNCGKNLVFEIPFDKCAGERKSIEYYIEKHCNNGVVFKE